MKLSLADRYTVNKESVLMTGVQAVVRLILEQQRLDREYGHDIAAFVSGYEGSPLGGLDLELGRQRALLDAHAVTHRPGLNEELAATSVFGTQLVPGREDARCKGVVGWWYGKAPGLDRASDAIRHANFGGTHPSGGAVALVGDDPSCKSSSVPSASEIALAELAIPTFYPADSQEVIEFGLHAVALSRATGLWAALKIVTNVADGSSPVTIPESRTPFAVPEPEPGLGPYRHQPTSKLMAGAAVESETSAYGVRLDLARTYARLNDVNALERHGAQDRIGIVAAGKAYVDVVATFDKLGLDAEQRERHGIRLLKLGMLFPLEPTIVSDFAQGLHEIIVVEDKRPFIETAIKELLYGRPDMPAVLGKREPGGAALVPQDGELSPDRLVGPLRRRLQVHGVPLPKAEAGRPARNIVLLPLLQASSADTPARTPYFCSGCPHSRSTQVPDGSLVATGIGCSSLVLLMDPKRVGDVIGLTQMGGEGAQWIGMSPYLDTPHLLQNVGEGTFHHSGSLAFRAAVAANVNITYKLLYNSAVAMTGGQQAVGLRSVAEITRMLAAEGVSRVIITTEDRTRYRRADLASGVEVWRRERIEEAQTTLAAVPGVTVLIHDQQCATEKRRDRKRDPDPAPETRVIINERICEGCGDCGEKSNCLSVEPVDTEYGQKTRIHQGSCNTDLACLDGDCPSFMTVLPTGKASSGRPEPDAGLDVPLPDPSPVVGPDEVTVRFTGIGGTGVVTVAQVLAQAAHFAGWHVRTLDQTGLAQKGGAVISDLTLSRTGTGRANKLGDAECDVYIGCDLLVAADEKLLAVAEPGRTVGILSLSRTPTGKMVSDPGATFPDVDAVAGRVRAMTRTDAGCAIDARRLAERLCGGDQFANVLLLGAAYQVGALPLTLTAIEEAIRLNGIAVDKNLRAFAVGRAAAIGRVDLPFEDQAANRVRNRVAARRTAAAAAVAAAVGAKPDGDLQRVVADRTDELTSYQNVAYARAYAEIVEQVRRAESAANGANASEQLTLTVARNLYKLMAYKDEYEVARLALDPVFAAAVSRQFGSDAKTAWRLHPPILRAMGMQQKLSLSRRATPLLIGLRSARRLRGTPLDPFGPSKMRRLERRLVEEYRDVVAEIIAGLTPGNYDVAVELAGLPDMVRGYEHVKLANIERYHERLADRRLAFAAKATA